MGQHISRLEGIKRQSDSLSPAAPCASGETFFDSSCCCLMNSLVHTQSSCGLHSTSPSFGSPNPVHTRSFAHTSSGSVYTLIGLATDPQASARHTALQQVSSPHRTPHTVRQSRGTPGPSTERLLTRAPCLPAMAQLSATRQ
jgi:hypothetical protein